MIYIMFFSRPHCDGGCGGVKHRQRGRVATAVLYCKVADKGGATTFTKSNIFVKPTAGSATFFTYKGVDGYMDDGYTEHSEEKTGTGGREVDHDGLDERRSHRG